MKQLLTILSILLLCTSTKVSAQESGWVIGYNVGMFTPQQRFFTVLEYKTDRDYPEADFNMPNFTKGLSLGFRGGDDNYFVEVLLSNKLLRSSRAQAENSHGELHAWKVKLKIRTLNFGAAFGNEFVKIGGSFDMGMFKIKQKYAPVESFDTEGWDKYFGSHAPVMGLTLFSLIQLDDFQIRPYFQFEFFRSSFFGAGSSANNAGVLVSIVL